MLPKVSHCRKRARGQRLAALHVSRKYFIAQCSKHPRAVKSAQGCFYLVSSSYSATGTFAYSSGRSGGRVCMVLGAWPGHVLAVGDGLDDGARTLDGIAAGKDAGDARAAHLVGLKQAARGGFQILRAVSDRRAGAWLMDTMTLSAG